MKILAVDDSPTMREMLATTLDNAGHAVLQAADGTEAIKVLAANHVDMIISDLNMVVMSGLEFLHKVREIPVHRTTPFVFLTTEDDEELKRAARAASATAWMGKPFDRESLVSLVERLGPL